MIPTGFSHDSIHFPKSYHICISEKRKKMVFHNIILEKLEEYTTREYM